MRVLYLSHRIPYPPNKGEKIRGFHQLRAIAERHEVDLFTLADDPADVGYGTVLDAFCRTVRVVPVHGVLRRVRALPHLLTSTPLTLPAFRSRELFRAVSSALAERSYDRIFVYCSAMMQYVEHVRGIPFITDLVDVDSDKWRQYAASASFPMRQIYRREHRCLSAYERAICEKSDAVLVTTEREARLVKQLRDQASVHVIPVGIDLDYFTPAQESAADEPGIVFAGDMSYLPNVDAVTYFAGRVLPLVRRSLPSARFYVVGRKPADSVLKLRSLPGVEVTGTVPDVRPWLARAHVSVAPFRIAAGIQTKILEALACGLPVVATSRAAQGLSDSVAGILAIADDPDDMAGQLLRLLRDPRLARSAGMEGRARVAAAYDWDSALRKLLAIVENPLEKHLAASVQPGTA